MMLAALALSSLLPHAHYAPSPLSQVCFTKTKANYKLILGKCGNQFQVVAPMIRPVTRPLVVVQPETAALRYRPVNNVFRASADFDSVSGGGFSGSGTGESLRLVTYFNTNNFGSPKPVLINRFTFQRTNASQSIILGTLVVDENDDEDDCEDDLDYPFGPYYEPWGAGIGYSHYHPVYVWGDPPDMNGFGFGIDKFPNYQRPFSVYGSLWYYPSVSGNKNNFNYNYNAWKYEIGASINPMKSDGTSLNYSIEFGFKGDSWSGTGNSAGNSYRLSSPYIGFSYHGF